MTNEEFSKKFHSCSTIIQRIKLCISESRYRIWQRQNPENYEDKEYLDPILNLSENQIINNKPSTKGPKRRVYDFKYTARVMGSSLKLYFKCNFEGEWEEKMQIESLRDDTQEKK